MQQLDACHQLLVAEVERLDLLLVLAQRLVFVSACLAQLDVGLLEHDQLAAQAHVVLYDTLVG